MCYQIVIVILSCIFPKSKPLDWVQNFLKSTQPNPYIYNEECSDDLTQKRPIVSEYIAPSHMVQTPY